MDLSKLHSLIGSLWLMTSFLVDSSFKAILCLFLGVVFYLQSFLILRSEDRIRVMKDAQSMIERAIDREKHRDIILALENLRLKPQRKRKK